MGDFVPQFSEAFRARAVQRLVGPAAVSASALAQEVGVSQVTLSRWLRAARRMVPDPRPASKAWTGAEKLRLADLGRYLASESTIYRVLRAERLLAHRGRANAPRGRAVRAHIATGPN